MNMQEKLDEAFRVIQQSPQLYKLWNECRTQRDRDLMVARELWDLAFQAGYAQCDEDVSMGG